MAMLKDVLPPLRVLGSVCWPLTPCLGGEVGATGGRLGLELAVWCHLSGRGRNQWKQCCNVKMTYFKVQLWKIHPSDATVRLYGTHPGSLEIHSASLMSTQFVWQWLSEDTALFDVICQQYTSLIQQLCTRGSHEAPARLMLLLL